MTQQVKKPAIKTTLYPKSVQSNFAKVQYNPKKYLHKFNDIDYFAFGDSFVNMFLHVQNSFYIKLKGKSIKGLSKTDKQQRHQIQKWVNALPKHVTLIFNFGQVDLNLIRYYKIIHDETYPDETFYEYVNWISSLKRKCIVIGIFASPIQRDHIVETLVKYNTFEGSQPDSQAILKQHAKTENIRKQWNDLIQAACEQKGIRFLNIFKHHKEISEQFIDQNPKTIHLRYLPCIIQVRKYIPNLKIDLRKSLEIEHQYVTQKTSRYYQNLLLLEQKKRLQSLETQQTRTQNNSSKDPLQQQDLQQDSANQLSQCASESPNASQKLENQIMVPIQQGYANLQALKQSEVDENDQFIALLGIPNIKSTQQLFQKIRKPHNIELLWAVSQQVIEKGIYWVNQERYDVDMIDFFLVNSLSLIKDISQVQQQIDSGQIQFSKVMRTKLQSFFQKNLNSDDKTRLIEDVITFILLIYGDQKKYKLSILSEKLIFIVIKEVILSIYKRTISNNIDRKYGIKTDLSCLCKLRDQLGAKMNQVFIKESKKQKIDQMEFYTKFLELVLTKQLNDLQVQQKTKQFEKLLNEDYPYAIFSDQVYKKMLNTFKIEVILCQKRLQLSVKQKTMLVFHQNNIKKMKQNVYKHRQQLKKILNKIQKQSEQKRKIIEANHYCTCGCLTKALHWKE